MSKQVIRENRLLRFFEITFCDLKPLKIRGIFLFFTFEITICDLKTANPIGLGLSIILNPIALRGGDGCSVSFLSSSKTTLKYLS